MVMIYHCLPICFLPFFILITPILCIKLIFSISTYSVLPLILTFILHILITFLLAFLLSIPPLILQYRLYQLGSSSSISTDPLASQKKPLQAYLVIMVMTAPDELERRQAVRQTWLDTGSAELLSYFVIGMLSGSSGQGAAVIRRIHRASRFFISGVFSVNDFDVRRNHTRYEKCELDEAR